MQDDRVERILQILAPKTERPCDCDRCYCQNQGDAEAVAEWDRQNSLYLQATEIASSPPQN